MSAPPPADKDTVERVRVAVYQSFARRGRGPSLSDLQAELRVPESAVQSALVSLHEKRDLVLAAGAAAAFRMAAAGVDASANEAVLEHADPVLLAHPFAGVNLGFSVLGTSALWRGGCAWDAFALPALLPNEAPMLVATRCPGCHAPIAVNVSGEHAPAPADVAATADGTRVVAHFATPMKDAWDDVVQTCRLQQLFCNQGCVDAWCKHEGRERGYVMDLGTLWKLASGWYKGRLEFGYKRREPAEAKDYFRSVGLKGSFWGLED